MAVNRYTIVETLKTQLEAITVAGGYLTTVAIVERCARVPEEIPRTARKPFIGIMPGEEVFNYNPTNTAMVDFTIYLTLIVDGAAQTSPALTNLQTIGLRLSNLQDDVFKALKANPHMNATGGNYAVSIVPVRCGTSEGDATMLQVGAGYMEIELRARYRRDYGATT